MNKEGIEEDTSKAIVGPLAWCGDRFVCVKGGRSMIGASRRKESQEPRR